MPGRRYSDGLHQAIEAKENVKVKRESKTLATITFQKDVYKRQVQFITQAIKASYGFDYPNREGVFLERVLEVLKMPVVLGGYEMI